MRRIVEIIQRRSKEEWEQFAKNRFIDLRIWLQEHGEQSFVLALVLGILFVLLFKLFVFIAAALVLVSYSIWHIAYSEDQLKERERQAAASDVAAAAAAPDQPGESGEESSVVAPVEKRE